MFLEQNDVYLHVKVEEVVYRNFFSIRELVQYRIQQRFPLYFYRINPRNRVRLKRRFRKEEFYHKNCFEGDRSDCI